MLFHSAKAHQSPSNDRVALEINSLSFNHGRSSPVDLVERSCIRETAVPHLVDDPCGVGFIFTMRSTRDRQSSSSSYTLLVLLRKLPLASGEELPGPSTFST